MSRWPLTIRGTGAVLIALLCLLLAQRLALTELLYLAVLLLGGVGASIATLYLVQGSERVTRSFSPDVVEAGSDVHVRLKVEVRSPLPGAQGRWADALPDGVSGESSGVFPETASGIRVRGGSVELAYDAIALRRGIRPVGPLSVVSSDPFGFARRRHTIGGALPLTVTPAVVDLGPVADQSGEAGGSMQTTTDQLGQGADNLVPRHYIPGDSMRRIHWRASAHRDELMVRQEEQETTPEAVVVLDRSARHWSAEARRTPGSDDAFETAVSACVSVAAHLVREGYLVSVLDADALPLSDPIEGGDGSAIERLAIDLATVKAHRDTTLDALVGLFAGAPTGPLVYVTGRAVDEDAAGLSRLARHSSLPVLLATRPEPGVLAHLAREGWRAAEIAPGSDLAAAWGAAVGGDRRGAERVGA